MDELIELHEILIKHFNEEPLKTLSFKLKIPYDDLPALGRENKARELVVYCHQHGRLPELVQAIKKQRPRVVLSDALMAYLPDGKTAVVEPVSVPPPKPNPKPAGENQARIFVKKNIGKIGAAATVLLFGTIAIVLLFTILLNLPDLLQNPNDPTQETDAAATTTPGQDSTAVIAAVTDEIQNPAATNQVETPTTTPASLPTLTATPTRTPSPTLQPTPTPTLDPSIPPPNPTLHSRWIRPSDNMVMVYVPGGDFLMGSNPAIDPNAEADEQPQHQVTLDSFWIDRTEVTSQQYLMCVQDGFCTPTANSNNYLDSMQPVYGASWFNANSYCSWAGGQLPTEAQWEYAARGNDGRLFPWGNEIPTCDLAQFSDCDGDSVAVGSFSPVHDSWIGTVDMAGNVWEWVSDWYDSNYYRDSPDTNPIGPENGDTRVARGGSWFIRAQFLRVANRTFFSPTLSNDDFGFRCAVPSP